LNLPALEIQFIRSLADRLLISASVHPVNVLDSDSYWSSKFS